MQPVMSTCIVATWMKGLSTLTTAARATAAAIIGSECFFVSASSAACTKQRLTEQHSSDHQARPLQTIPSTLLRGCHHGCGVAGRLLPLTQDSNTQAACLFHPAASHPPMNWEQPVPTLQQRRALLFSTEVALPAKGVWGTSRLRAVKGAPAASCETGEGPVGGVPWPGPAPSAPGQHPARPAHIAPPRQPPAPSPSRRCGKGKVQHLRARKGSQQLCAP